MRIAIFSLIFFSSLSLCGQTQKMELSTGDTLNSVVDKKLQYAFDEFTDGIVLFKDRSISKAKLNYSYLAGEIQFFVDDAKQIMTLTEPEKIASVSIGNRQFMYSGKGTAFIEMLAGGGNIGLGVLRKSKVMPEGKTGAYGTVNNTSSTYTVSRMENNPYHQLSNKEHINISIDNTYYLVVYSDDSIVLIKNAKSYTKLYPKEKTSLIEKYIKENGVSFRKETDLIKLTEYCNQL